MKFLKRVLRDEKGATMIMVAIALVMIFGFAVLTIDLSLVQLAKTQLQNAADAGALAGALGLATSDGDQAVATAEAIKFAGLNVAVQDIQQPVVIGEADVTFPGTDSITVTTHRTIGTGDPVTLYFLKVLDPLVENKGEVTARATAAVSLVCGTYCLKPFAVPDKWDDANDDSTWNPADEYTDLNGNGVWDVGEPLTLDHDLDGVWDPEELYDPDITGYTADRDVGVEVILRPSKPNWEGHMEWYFTVNYPPKNTGNPLTGADITLEWILGCEPYLVSIGDELQKEPGAMYGPTIGKGLLELIELDPNAHWNEITDEVEGSENPENPRVIKVPAFDPSLGLHNCGPGRECVTVSKIIVLFVEDVLHDNSVVGRFMRTITEGETNPDCPGGFLFTVTLVE